MSDDRVKKQYKKEPKFELSKKDQWDYYYSIAYPEKSGLQNVPYPERAKAFEKLIEISGTEDTKYRKYIHKVIQVLVGYKCKKCGSEEIESIPMKDMYK